MSSRPLLTPALDAEVFTDHYWLRSELIAFCRTHGGPSSGAKLELVERIAGFLRDGRWPAVTPVRRRPTRRMPAELTPETLIGEGWTCSQPLRAFFEREVGPAFRFTAAIRRFISESAGHPLADAIAEWDAQQQSDSQPEIGPQFEYNRFTRAHHASHPEATREDVVVAWRRHRDTPRSQRASSCGAGGGLDQR